MNSEYVFTNEVNGLVLEDVNIKNPNLKAKIYIPSLMTKIPGEAPIKQITPTNGLGVFVNSSGIPNISSAAIFQVNYFEAAIQSSIALRNMEKTISLIKGHLHGWIGVGNDPGAGTSLTYIVRKGTVCRCSFLNNKFSKLSYQLNENDIEPCDPIAGCT